MNHGTRHALVWLAASLLTATTGCNRGERAAGQAHEPPAQPSPMTAAEVKPPARRPLPKNEWPLPVVELVDELARRNIAPESVEVRPANPETDNACYDGFYWRMPADAATVQAHIEMFDLDEVASGSPLTSRMFDVYPAAWPRPEAEQVTWYAWPHNRDDDAIRAHFWQIMLHDHQAGSVTFFYWIWDIGI